LRFDQRKKRAGSERENPNAQIVEADPEDAMKLEEQRQLLGVALKELTPEEREVIETAFFSELTYNETAIKLNQPLGTVKTRIRSGLSKLRRAMGQDVK
jgi:RNA polymerase sigma-70 factor (ECF subfamily)